MTIHVKPHLEAVLKAHVDSGNFPNVEAALEAAILALDVSTIDDGLSEDDLEWIRPLIDEGLAAAAAGKTHSSEEVWAHIEEQLKTSERS